MYRMEICDDEQKLISCFIHRNNFFIQQLKFPGYLIFDGLDELSTNFLFYKNNTIIGSFRLVFTLDNDYIVEFIVLDNVNEHLFFLLDAISEYLRHIGVLEFIIKYHCANDLLLSYGFCKYNSLASDYHFYKKYLYTL